jgi:hypothetical protein
MATGKENAPVFAVNFCSNVSICGASSLAKRSFVLSSISRGVKIDRGKKNRSILFGCLALWICCLSLISALTLLGFHSPWG